MPLGQQKKDMYQHPEQTYGALCMDHGKKTDNSRNMDDILHLKVLKV